MVAKEEEDKEGEGIFKDPSQPSERNPSKDPVQKLTPGEIVSLHAPDGLTHHALTA